jgi:hypothetical protein
MIAGQTVGAARAPEEGPVTRRLSLAGLLVAAALLAACGGGGEAPSNTATSTASQPAPTGTTVVRATRTPRPATPTPIPATATPATPSPVALPTLPEELSQYAAAIGRYLTATEAPAACPDQLLDAWTIPISPAARCALGDTDADGQDELVLVLAGPLRQEVPVMVAVLDKLAGSWGVAFQSPSTEEGGGFLVSVPSGNLDDILWVVQDVNAVPGAEIIYRPEYCGAHTCYTTVEVYGWAGSTYADLTDGDISISYADTALDDRDGDGVLEIILHGGSIGSVGAGPTRTRTEVYSWDGQQYVLAQVTLDPSEWLYHNVLDADDAFAAGDLNLALELYTRALEDQSLLEAKENERGEMDPYLHFRIAITYMAQGGAAAEAAQSLDAAVNSNPGSLHGEMARAFRDAWLPARDATAACLAANDYVQVNLQAFQEFWYFGYGNREFSPQGLCPF